MKHMNYRLNLIRLLVLIVLPCVVMTACVTAHIEDQRTTPTGILAGEGVVIMAKSYHLGNKTEAKFTKCVSSTLSRGSSALRVIPNNEFVDALFPWFEPRTVPLDIKELSILLKQPGVADTIAKKDVRYIIWLDGDTDKIAGGGTLSCAAGPGGAGCFGFAWWQDDAKYDATVWDITALQSAGTVSANVSGTSYLPAIIIPIPLIARTRSKACKGLADQLKLFIVTNKST